MWDRRTDAGQENWCGTGELVRDRRTVVGQKY